MKRKKILLLSLLFLVVYVVLLFVLAFAENNAPDSNINTMGEAFWYSLVTMTTVGYGDLFPVTPVGRVIGFIFLLLSVGFLAFVISAFVSVLTDRILPQGRLRAQKKAVWYIFDTINDETKELAHSVHHANHDALCIFFGNSLEEPLCPDCNDMVFFEGSLLRLLQLHGKNSKNTVFFFDDNDNLNYENALSMEPDVTCIVKTSNHPDKKPSNILIFDPYDSTAREYWRKYTFFGDDVVIIGDGKFARSILERALIANVFSPDQNIHYHIFGDWKHFRNNHYGIKGEMEIDTVTFYDDDWNEHPKMICESDRIIICHDVEEINYEILSEIRKYYAVSGDVHILIKQNLSDETCFGMMEEIYTNRVVLKNSLLRTAINMHNIYKEGKKDATVPDWDELSEFTRQSNIAAADHLFTKIFILLPDVKLEGADPKEICEKAYRVYKDTYEEKKDFYREIEHLRWNRFHRLYNWTYCEVRDNSKRRHNLLLPFAQLDEASKARDDYAWELLDEVFKY